MNLWEMATQPQNAGPRQQPVLWCRAMFIQVVFVGSLVKDLFQFFLNDLLNWLIQQEKIEK